MIDINYTNSLFLVTLFFLFLLFFLIFLFLILIFFFLLLLEPLYELAHVLNELFPHRLSDSCLEYVISVFLISRHFDTLLCLFTPFLDGLPLQHFECE